MQVQHVQVGRQPMQAAALAFLPPACSLASPLGGARRGAESCRGEAKDGVRKDEGDGSLLLALGGLDNHVHIYLQESIACFSQTGSVMSGGEAQAGGPANASLQTPASRSPAVEARQRFVPVCKLSGHQDWVRCLTFTPTLRATTPQQPPQSQQQHRHTSEAEAQPPATDCQQHEQQQQAQPFLYLASGSQDRSIRVWKIAGSATSASVSDAAAATASSSSLPSAAAISPVIDEVQLLTMQVLAELSSGPSFETPGASWQVELDGLLIGHEDWVHSLTWQPPIRQIVSPISPSHLPFPLVTLAETSTAPSTLLSTNRGPPCGNLMQPLRLLSSSMDRTVLMWRPESGAGGLWYPDVSLGDAAHSALGFFGAVWSPAGDAVLAHGFGGSLHLWRNVRAERGRGKGRGSKEESSFAAVRVRLVVGEAGELESRAEASREADGCLGPREEVAGASLGADEGSSPGEGTFEGGEAVAERGREPPDQGNKDATSNEGEEEEARGREEEHEEEEDEEEWCAAVVPSGHFGAATDVCWDASGTFLLSVSHDQVGGRGRARSSKAL